MHALIIEDEFMVAAQIEDVLRTIGYDSFDFVESEDDAIDAARVRCPDLISVDHRITAGSGVGAVREICADRAIAVVFVTDYREEVESALPDAVIMGKPFAERTLREAVARAVSMTASANASAGRPFASLTAH